MSILMSESAALSPGSCAGIWNQMLIVIPPAFSAQECSGYLAFSVLHMNFSDFFSLSVKTVIGILMGVSLNV